MLHVMLFPMLYALYFPQYMCSAQYGCLMLFLNFVFSRYVAQVLTVWFWGGSSCPLYWWYHFCLCILHALYFYCKVFLFWDFLKFFLDHISLSEIVISIIINIVIVIVVSCHTAATSPETTAIPTAQCSSVRLQYLPYYIWCSKYSWPL